MRGHPQDHLRRFLKLQLLSMAASFQRNFLKLIFFFQKAPAVPAIIGVQNASILTVKQLHAILLTDD